MPSIRVLMESIPQKIKGKREPQKNLINTNNLIVDSEEKLSSQLSQVHTWYYIWKLEKEFLEENLFPLADSTQTYLDTMEQWAKWEQFSQIMGKFSSARDVLYKSLVSKDPHPRDSMAAPV